MRRDRKSGGLLRRLVLRIAVFACFITFAAPSALAEEYTYWWQMPKLTAGGERDQFGSSVAMGHFNNRLVVGAPHDWYDDDGAVYYFECEDSWDMSYGFQDPDGEPADWFGAAVGFYYSWAIVGSPQDDGSGSAVVIRPVSDPWSADPCWLAHESDSYGDGFGWTVAIDGYVPGFAVVGAPYDDIGSATDAGAAYLYWQSDGC